MNNNASYRAQAASVLALLRINVYYSGFLVEDVFVTS